MQTQNSLIVDPSGKQFTEVTDLRPKQEQPPSLDLFIMQAASRQDVDVDKLERLLAMKERLDAAQRSERFFDSLATVQAQMPQLEQNGCIDYGAGKAKIAYARFEDIDAVIRPIYSPAGFSVSWDSAPAFDGKMVKVTGTFAAHGHKETREMTGPVDNSGGKNGIQGVASSVAYLKRQISKMFWNLVERGADKDGANLAALTPISQDQADDLRTRLADLKADMPKFLKMFKVGSLEELRVGQMKEVMAAVEQKERKARG